MRLDLLIGIFLEFPIRFGTSKEQLLSLSRFLFDPRKMTFRQIYFARALKRAQLHHDNALNLNFDVQLAFCSTA